MGKYDYEDYVAAVQLAAWLLRKQSSEVTTSEYRDTGLNPSARTILNNFDSWDDATSEAAENPQYIPSEVPELYRVVAGLRRFRDRTGHPVTGFQYQHENDSSVSYHDILSVFSTWTEAKIVAGVHRPGETEFYQSHEAVLERVASLSDGSLDPIAVEN